MVASHEVVVVSHEAGLCLTERSQETSSRKCALHQTSEEKEVKKTSFPPGWDEERVRRVLAHYEEQTEDEVVAEDEAAFEDRTQTVKEIPTELVPAVRELIARHGR
jgi:hypothetical protein